MERPRVQFTLRRILILIGIVAILLGTGRWAYRRFAGPVFTKIYYVGDLMRPDGDIRTPATVAELNEQAALLKSAVTPDEWSWSNRSVTPSDLRSFSLVVRQSKDGHQQVADWFRHRRDRQYARNR